MSGSDARWVLEVHLINDRVVEQHITEDEAKQLVASRAFIWQGHSEDQKQASAIFTIFAQRLDKGKGFVSVTDPGRKTWLLPVGTIMAVNIADKEEKSTIGRIGFAPPIVEEGQPGTGAGTQAH